MAELDRDKLGEQLSAYVDGELTAAETDAVRELLATSPAARRQYQELRDVSQRLRALPRVHAPADLAALRSRWTTRTVAARPSFRGWRFAFWLQGGVGIAACVLLFIVGTFAGWNARRLVEPPATVPRELSRVPSGSAKLKDESTPVVSATPAENDKSVDSVAGADRDDIRKSAGESVSGYAAAPVIGRVTPSEAAGMVIEDAKFKSAEQGGGQPSTADGVACVTLIISPATAADYKQAVATLNDWKTVTQQPPFAPEFEEAQQSQEKLRAAATGTEASPSIAAASDAENSANNLSESTFFLSADQAVALKRELDQPQLQNTRLQVDARADQMRSVEPLLTAATADAAGAAIDAGKMPYLGPPPPFSNYSRLAEKQQAEPATAPTSQVMQETPAAAEKKEAPSAARKPTVARRAPAGQSPAQAGRAGGKSANAPAMRAAREGVEADCQVQAGLPVMDSQLPMGPPAEPVQFLRLRVTVLPPAELIEASDSGTGEASGSSQPASSPGPTKN